MVNASKMVPAMPRFTLPGMDIVSWIQLNQDCADQFVDLLRVSNPTTFSAILLALGNAPVAWASLYLLPRLRSAGIGSSVLHLFLRCGERDTMNLIQQAITDGLPGARHLAIEAAGVFGDARCLPTLISELRATVTVDDGVHDQTPSEQEALYRSLALMGPTLGRQINARLTMARRIPTLGLAYTIHGLGMAGGLGDASVIANIMGWMEQNSDVVRTASAEAFRNIGDALRDWSHPRDLASLDPEARDYISLLVSLMEGNPMSVADIYERDSLSGHSTQTESQSEIDQDLPESEHWRELFLRLGLCVLIMGFIYILSFNYYKYIIHIFSMLVYNINPEIFLKYINSSFLFKNAGVNLFITIWLTSPVILYQIWLFCYPGLLPTDRHIITPMLRSIYISVFTIPILIPIILSRMINFTVFPSNYNNPLNQIEFINRLCLDSFLIVISVFITRPIIYNILKRAHMHYMIDLATGKPLFYRMTFIRIMRRAGVLFSINIIFLSLILPINFTLLIFSYPIMFLLYFITLAIFGLIARLNIFKKIHILGIIFSFFRILLLFLFFLFFIINIIYIFIIFWPISVDCIFVIHPRGVMLAAKNLWLVILRAIANSQQSETI